MSGRLRSVLLGVFLAAFVAVPPASAKVYLSGLPATTTSGSIVNAYVSGCEAAPSCGPTVRGVWVYMAKSNAGPTDFSALRKPRWFVGKVTAAGKLSFKVPQVRAGRYRLIARLKFGNSKPQYLPASSFFVVQG